MAPEKFFFIPGLTVAVIDRPELAVGSGVLHHKGQICYPVFCVLDGGMSGIPPLRQAEQSAFQFSIAAAPTLRQEVHGSGSLFQIVQLRPMGEAHALLCLDIVLDINEQTDLSAALRSLARRSGVSGDPCGEGFFGIAHPQGFKPSEPFLIRSPGGNILAPLDLIAFLLQSAEQFFKVGAGGQEPVDGGFQFCLIAGAVPCGLMFNIALALVLSGDDDGQSMLFTNTVAVAADVVIAPLVGMVVLVIREADRIENQVVVNVILVYVGGQHKFIFAAQDFFCKLHPDLMGFLRRYLPRLKGLDQMATQVGALVDGVEARPFKLDIRGLGGTPIGGYQQFPVRFLRVADVINGRFQR